MAPAIANKNQRLWGHGRFLAELALATAVLYLISYLAVLAHLNQRFSPIYPEAGFALALLWRHGARFWPAAFLSTALLSMRLGSQPWSASGVGWLDVLIMLTAVAWLQRRQVQASLASTRDLAGFGLAIVASSSLAIPAYAALVGLASHLPLAQALLFGAHYCLATLFSFLIFTPVMVMGPPRQSPDRWGWMGIAVAAIVAIGWTILAVRPELRERLLFLVLPFVIICAVTGRTRGASLAAAALGLVMIAMEAETPGSVVDVSLHGLFVATLSLTGFLLAVVINEREQSAAELAHRARHDTLTGLINRYEFEERLRLALRDISQKYALLYLDLDQFKLVNDTCGHLAGDDMLRKLAAALKAALPDDVVLARLGGDEFGCLLPHSGLEEAQAAAERLHQAIRGFKYEVGELSFTVGASVGATFLSPSEDRGPDDPLGRADLACYTAKEQGRNRTYIYTPSDAAMNQRHADVQALSQLQAALAGGLFQLYVQRIANIGDPHAERPFYEVLLRYAGADDQTVADILAHAQRYGVIAQVDRWVFEQSARFLQRSAGRDIRLSINVTATTLESEGFERFVLALPQQYGFDARQMCIEITEVVAVQNLTGAVGVLQRLRQRGFDIALDDFGAGVASFGYLSELPVTLVKIDGHFIRDLGKDPAAEVIIESLARVAALRGIACIAEWVEDLAVIPRLRELGVTFAQGFTIHRPVPLAAVEATVEAEIAIPSPYPGKGMNV